MTSTTPAEPTTPPTTGRDDHWARKLARLRARQLPEQVLQLCDDMASRQHLDRAKLDVARLRMADAETGGEQRELEAAEAELVAAQKAFNDVSVTLSFRSLPRPALDGLIRQHPPTEDQAEDGDAWNPTSFPAALVSAAHVERDDDGREVDGMTVQEAQDLLDGWPVAESNSLFAAAWQAQQINRATASELGKG